MTGRSTIRAAIAASLLLGSAAAAPTPSLKPPAPESPYVTPGDERALRAVFAALEDREYAQASELRAALQDPVARSLADWALYRSNEDTAPIEELGAFLAAHEGWPQTRFIQQKAEKAMEDIAAPRVIAFFADRAPITGQGKLALGRALSESGEPERGAALVREAWTEHDWSARTERAIRDEFAGVLRTEDHVAKADRQLFEIKATATKRLLGLLPAEERRKANARIAFLLRDRNAPKLYEALPEDAQLDAGALHAATRYYRRTDQDWTATLTAGLAPMDAAGLRSPEAWFRERRLLARTALKEGRYRDAYVLSAFSGLEEGADFAEAEFMAGWIALRYLAEPERAQAHFAYLNTGVTSPISLARGTYWLARAQEAAGEAEAARATYRAAAGYPYAYYGQLAAEALGEDAPGTGFPDEADVSPDARTVFEARPMVAALRILAEIGEDWAFDRFARALDDQLTEPDAVRLYGELMAAERKPYLSVRAGKVARTNGVSAPHVIYPLVDVPERAASFVETPLILGLSRQESEFNPRAFSSARARGLMQMLDSTARITARKEGIEYRRDRLMDDPRYNMTLGAAHLSHLLERFDGSYLMVLAGYNAGPHRVDQWVEQYGDPRDPLVDPVDWVERIPFSETRNYVMRVLENVQIYRARLGGGPIAGRLTADLTRGGGNPAAIGQPPGAVLTRVASEAEPRGDALNVPQARPRALDAFEDFERLHDVVTGTDG